MPPWYPDMLKKYNESGRILASERGREREPDQQIKSPEGEQIEEAMSTKLRGTDVMRSSSRITNVIFSRKPPIQVQLLPPHFLIDPSSEGKRVDPNDECEGGTRVSNLELNS